MVGLTSLRVIPRKAGLDDPNVVACLRQMSRKGMMEDMAKAGCKCSFRNRPAASNMVLPPSSSVPPRRASNNSNEPQGPRFEVTLVRELFDLKSEFSLGPRRVKAFLLKDFPANAVPSVSPRSPTTCCGFVLAPSRLCQRPPLCPFSLQHAKTRSVFTISLPSRSRWVGEMSAEFRRVVWKMLWQTRAGTTRHQRSGMDRIS